jgi:hypothetical protein
MDFIECADHGASLSEKFWGEWFAVDGQTYRGTIVDLRGKGRVVFTGIEELVDFVIAAPKDQFTAVPIASPRPVLTARGSRLRIIEVASGETSYRLSCVGSGGE